VFSGGGREEPKLKPLGSRCLFQKFQMGIEKSIDVALEGGLSVCVCVLIRDGKCLGVISLDGDSLDRFSLVRHVMSQQQHVP
jgi:hypothetical protein